MPAVIRGNVNEHIITAGVASARTLRIVPQRYIGFLESSLIFFRDTSLRHANANLEHVHGL
jgi:hypothetical protein